MILYYAVTNYHILTCILHKLKYHKKDSAILGIPNYHKNCKFLKNNLLQSNLFSDILVVNEFDWSFIKQNGAELIKEDIIRICDDFEKNNINFSDFCEINICGDQNAIGVYLCNYSIKYNFFEDGCGVLSDEDRLMGQFKKVNYHRYEILYHLNIPGNHSCVVKRFGDLKCQLSGYTNKKDIHFSIREELASLDRKTIEKIIHVFDDKFEFNIRKNSDLLLTWHYVSAGMMTVLEQELYYCIMVDYFSNVNHLAVKPHPADDEVDYSSLFPTANVITRLLPSELLPYCSNYLFHSLITGYSTSINGLSKFAKNVIDFNSDYDDSYRKMNKYYTTVKLLEMVFKNFGKIPVYGIGINIKQFSNIFKLLHLKIDIAALSSQDYSFLDDEKKIIIVDEGDLSIVSDDEFLKNTNHIIIFLSESILSNFLSKNLNVLPILIRKKFIHNKFFELESKEEMIYLYHAENIFSDLLNFCFSKHLPSTGIVLEVNIWKQYACCISRYYYDSCKLKEMELENSALKNELNIIKGSKGYKLLVKYWNFINKLKNKVGRK